MPWVRILPRYEKAPIGACPAGALGGDHRGPAGFDEHRAAVTAQVAELDSEDPGSARDAFADPGDGMGVGRISVGVTRFLSGCGDVVLQVIATSRT